MRINPDHSSMRSAENIQTPGIEAGLRYSKSTRDYDEVFRTIEQSFYTAVCRTDVLIGLCIHPAGTLGELAGIAF